MTPTYKTMIAVTLLALTTIQYPSRARGETDVSAVNAAIKRCLELVHRLPADQYSVHFYREFDAFFNPASGLVQNNAWRNGDIPVKYEFDKCMVGQGVPLK